MRRQWWLRPFAAAMAVWLSLTIGEPGVIHFCPAHTGAIAAPSVPPAAAAATAHDHAAPERSTPPGHNHAACTCLGTCSLAGFGAALPAAAPRVPVPAIVARVVGARLARQVPSAAPARLLPFANGPPPGV